MDFLLKNNKYLLPVKDFKTAKEMLPEFLNRAFFIPPALAKYIVQHLHGIDSNITTSGAIYNFYQHFDSAELFIQVMNFLCPCVVENDKFMDDDYNDYKLQIRKIPSKIPPQFIDDCNIARISLKKKYPEFDEFIETFKLIMWGSSDFDDDIGGEDLSNLDRLRCYWY